MSGILGVLYSSTYPEHIDRTVVIDSLFPYVKESSEVNIDILFPYVKESSAVNIDTLRDIFTRIRNLGIEKMVGQKYGDFFRESPISYPELIC